MSSIMRRRRGLKSAISILLSEGVGCNTHILSGRRRSTPPRRSRRGSGFVQSGGFCEGALTRGCGGGAPRALPSDLIEAGLNEGAGGTNGGQLWGLFEIARPAQVVQRLRQGHGMCALTKI